MAHLTGHTPTAIEAVPASGPGALAGFESRCTCGLVMRSSLLTIVTLDVADHLRYWEREAARAPKASRKRRGLPVEPCRGCESCDPAIAAAYEASIEAAFADWTFDR